MSVLIKGMKMPQSCLLCPFGDEFGKCCVNLELEDANELTHSCPLVELPDHGDLIDRDALRTDGLMYRNGVDEDGLIYVPLRDVMKAISNASVVIPAERSQE